MIEISCFYGFMVLSSSSSAFVGHSEGVFMMSLLRGVLRKKSMAKEEDVFFDMNINFQRNFILIILYQNCNSMCKEILENCLGR